jgi:hypothetical protein
MFLVLCLNLSVWVMNTAQVIPYGINQEWNPNDVKTWFNLNLFNPTTIIGLAVGGIAGLISWITKAGVYANGIILIWVLSIVLVPIQTFTIGAPILIYNILTPFGLAWLGVVPEIFFLFGFFMFCIELLAQRQIT